ncbi:MAG: PilZ domain-containing protein [Candidatus Aminicenantes bacterium]|nr:PilZ domain-containing protein [Candidatus Aminicenantes bacterium]
MTVKATDSSVQAKPHLVIAHEDASKRQALRAAFEPDFSVHTASSCREAIGFLGRLAHIDALIVDRHLPSAETGTLLRYVQEMVRNPETIAKLLLSDNGAGREAPALPVNGWVDEVYEGGFDADRIRRRLRSLIIRKTREKRGIMRAPLGPAAVEADIGLIGRVPVENISENGMFVKAVLPRDYIHPITIRMPDGSTLLATGRVVRIDEAAGGTGIQFLLMEEDSRRILLRLIADSQIEKDLPDLRAKYPFLRRDSIVAFSDPPRIDVLLSEAFGRPETELTVIGAGQRSPVILRPAGIEPGRMCRLIGEGLAGRFKTSDSIFVSFQSGYATYTFETVVYRIDDGGRGLECLYPRILFYSEKRAARRAASDEALELEITLPPPFQRTIRGPVADISTGGASFLTGDREVALLIGTPLASIRIIHGGRVVRDVRGEIRNVLKVDDGNGGLLRYGVQFGIARMAVQAGEMPSFEAAAEKPRTRDTEKLRRGPRRQSDLSELAKRPPRVVRLENAAGEEIVGLLNTSLELDGGPVPVVIIPPAFGKTKETLFALAETIVENFYTRGKPVAVLRYDGVRRKGESYKDPDASEPPFEMIHASVSQGADDIKAVLDWLDLNPMLKASSIVLVTFSLSALEARVVLRQESYRRKIGCWISCMGTMEFRELMNRVNCGLDLLEQFQLGIDLGVIPILGNLISMGPYASDVVANRVATLDQAREDMALIDLPITWIYGEHDHWVKAEFVRDIMSVQVDAPREVVSVPLGHNARTSEEALQLFGTITDQIHRFLTRDSIRPAPPDKANMEIIRRAEKDRLPARRIKDRRAYWQRYLVGEDRLIGFDVMALSDDYRQLMEDQRRALDLQPGDRFLDLGGGTGNFAEHLLDGGHPLPTLLTIADLIPKAMARAAGKLLSRFPALRESGRFGLLALDAELNRYIPVRRFLDGEIGRFKTLAEERIENLALASAERIDAAFSPRLHRLLRGETISAADDRWLKSRFDIPEVRVIVDFNLAVRQLQGRAGGEAGFRKLGFPGGLQAAAHLPVRPGVYNKILMSLVLSYIFNPVETLAEARRIIAPEGRLVLSTMRPDADASGLFTRLVAKIEAAPDSDFPGHRSKAFLLESIRSFLNDAQALVELEEAGTFDFFDPDRLAALLEEAGWESLCTIPSFGNPAQGYIVVARPRAVHG